MITRTHEAVEAYEDDIKVDTLWEETIVTMITHTHEAVDPI